MEKLSSCFFQEPDDNDYCLNQKNTPYNANLNDTDIGNFNRVEKDRVFQTVGDDCTPVDFVDIIEGYLFGTTVVAVTGKNRAVIKVNFCFLLLKLSSILSYLIPDDDRPALVYESGPKCLSVLGFTKKINVPLYLLKGSGCYQFFPTKEEVCLSI